MHEFMMCAGADAGGMDACQVNIYNFLIIFRIIYKNIYTNYE